MARIQAGELSEPYAALKSHILAFGRGESLDRLVNRPFALLPCAVYRVAALTLVWWLLGAAGTFMTPVAGVRGPTLNPCSSWGSWTLAVAIHVIERALRVPVLLSNQYS